MKRFLTAAVVVAMTLVAQPALAHKVIIDVYTDDTTVEGEIGFSNGDMSVDTVVDIYDGDGNRLGVTKTDADGVFIYTPTKAVKHVFRANLGAGHIATYELAKEDLPSALLDGNGAAPANAEPQTEPKTGQVAPAAPAPAASVASVSNSELKSLIAKEVSRAIKPLRKDLAAYKEKNDLQTTLGGIGYIMGLFGVAAYVLARRREKKEG